MKEKENESSQDQEGAVDEGTVVEKKSQVSIAEPMFIWILLLVIAMVINVLVGSAYVPKGQVSSILKASAHFILFMPGAIILPTIVGAVIGAEIGRRAKSMNAAIKSGLINGVYATIIYLITIFIIYEIIVYIIPALSPSAEFLAVSWLAIPSVILVVLSMLFAALSHSRKVET
ncbi:MAG: hypothetical protein ACP5RF_03770 [Candidatus Micrarchaeia archaeon]